MHAGVQCGAHQTCRGWAGHAGDWSYCAAVVRTPQPGCGGVRCDGSSRSGFRASRPSAAPLRSSPQATDALSAGAPRADSPADSPPVGTPFVTRRMTAIAGSSPRSTRPRAPWAWARSALAQAQARIPGLVVTEAEPEAAPRRSTGLATWCLRYAPLVAPRLRRTGCGSMPPVRRISGRRERRC